jgi:hypothetical protein
MGKSDIPRIKGAAIREFLLWYAGEHGAERLPALAARMRAENRVLFDLAQRHLGVIASSWYPAPAIHELLDLMSEGLSAAQRERLVRNGAQATIAATLRGVYRLLFETMMSPERYARNAQKLFSRYCDTGTMEKTAPAPRTHRSVIRDWTSHHPLLCDFILHTGVYVYGAMGCRDVRLEKQACVARGDGECVFLVTWT